MNDLLNGLFGLDDIAFGVEGVALRMARPVSTWLWAVIVLAAASISWWSYTRLPGVRSHRWMLALARTATLIVLCILAAGPMLERQRTRIEQDWVIVLADRSASMTAPDLGDGKTRDDQLREALASSADMWAELAQSKQILWLGFDAGAYELQGPADVTASPPTGRRTALGAALDQALRKVAARPVSGIVILSDGRSIDAPSRAALRRLQSEQIPVLVVPLGSPDPVTDLAVRSVSTPRLAFVDDTVPVTVEIERLGAGEVTGRVELIDPATDTVLDTQPIRPADELGSGVYSVVLTTKPGEPGTKHWLVRVVPDNDDLIADNNSAEVSIELVDRPLRVLYFDGYPRWEHRYLKNLLLREQSIASSSLLLAADRRYMQEGDVILDRLPVSPEEWAEFDVVILGDVRAELFGQHQLEQLREHIAERGAGLLWIAGPGATPSSWAGTPLADLLPVRTSGAASVETGLPVWDEPVTLIRMPAADRLGVLALNEPGSREWPERLADPRTGWSRLHWVQRIDPNRVKPTAEVFAVAVPQSAYRPGLTDPLSVGTPAVLSMRYGAGRVIYVATDEIWRWRYGRGEDLPERFWLPLVRLLGRESLSRAGRPALLDITPELAAVDQPVRIRIELLDQALADAQPESITVTVTGEDGRRVDLTLGPEDDRGRSFAGTWMATSPGEFTVTPDEPLLAGLDLAERFEVAWPDDERRRPDTNHPLLAALANQTAGAVVAPSDLTTIADLLPNRELVITGTPETASLWDTPAALSLLLGLLTLEWVGRRLIKLS